MLNFGGVILSLFLFLMAADEKTGHSAMESSKWNHEINCCVPLKHLKCFVAFQVAMGPMHVPFSQFLFFTEILKAFGSSAGLS